MASESARTGRLNDLIREVEAWSTKRQKYYEDQVAFAKALLKGRGAEQLNNASVSSATLLLTDEIDEFLSE
jgi:hypothetical protein